MHTICSQCLPHLYKHPAFVECPTCREVSNVRVDQVPKNRDILEFIEYFTSQNTAPTQPQQNQSTTSIEKAACQNVSIEKLPHRSEQIPSNETSSTSTTSTSTRSSQEYELNYF